MTTSVEHVPLAVQKERLIKEGELYRIGVLHSKELLTQALRPDALFHSAVEHASGMAHARMGSLLQPGALGAGVSGLLSIKNARRIMPYVLTVSSFIARRRLIKPLLVIGVAVAAGTTWLMRRQRQQVD